jgi:APA family basic amino acid/polyamine antiporter
MALTVGAYLWPQQRTGVAIGAVLLILMVNLGGLERTVAVTRLLLVVSLTALTAVVVAGWSGGEADPTRLTPLQLDAGGVLRSAGFLFFAFAGYARIATLGEEVRDPEVTIPRAIPRALGLVLIVYAAVGFTTLAVLDVTEIASADDPLRLVAEAGPWPALIPVVRLSAGIAALGVLLNLIPGISRTVLAMARRRELPTWFAHVDGTRHLPVRSEVAVTLVVMLLVAVLDLTSAIAVTTPSGAGRGRWRSSVWWAAWHWRWLCRCGS